EEDVRRLVRDIVHLREVARRTQLLPFDGDVETRSHTNVPGCRSVAIGLAEIVPSHVCREIQTALSGEAGRDGAADDDGGHPARRGARRLAFRARVRIDRAV